MQVLSDPTAERAVLSGIYQHGLDAYLDVVDMISDNTFTIESNICIFKCIKHILDKEDANLDIPSIHCAAEEVGLSGFFIRKEEAQHLQAIISLPVNLTNVRKFAAKIRKLEVSRLLSRQLGEAQDKLMDITGEETITHILGIAEDSVLDLSSLLNDKQDVPQLIGHDLEGYLTYLSENPVAQIGVSTGFPVFDKSIGGGLRKGTINVLGARAKVGKTVLADNMGYHVASKLGFPVLNMDTEMMKEDHSHRILAMSTETSINDIETGKFAEKPDIRERLFASAKHLEKVPLYHKSIAGKPFEEQLAIMRRWLMQEVGLHEDGTAKDCVIIYDYLKLMDSSGLGNLQEYQMLGFMMSSFHNFAVRYKVPILAFIQLNRDGITKESSDAASGSDRIIWLCSNFTILKAKSDEEIAEDGEKAGNRKLVPVLARHGEGLDYNNYINCHFKGWCAQIKEGKTKLELSQESESTEGFVVEDDDDSGEQVKF